MNSIKKKILIFSVAYHPFIGGAEVAVKEITDRIKDYEFHLITVNLDGKQKKQERIGNIEVYRVGKGKIGKYLFPITAFLKASSLHKKNNFSATWSIMANYAGLAGLLFKKRFPKVPFVLTLQEGDSMPHIKKRMLPLYPLFKSIFKSADKITAISNYLSTWAKEMGARGEVSVIPNGVDAEKFKIQDSGVKIQELRKEIGVKEGEKLIITTSRLVKKNAVDQIILSLKHLPDNFRFFIAGIGEEEESLCKLTKELNIEDRVKFEGFVSPDKLPLYLKASDIFIRPSRSEGLGNSFLEAMAAGVPVIATSVGGIPDFLFDPEANPDKLSTGLFCEVDNPESIAKGVKRLIDDPKLRETIIKNAKENVLRNYDWQGVTQRITHEVFDGLN
ncbi:MAG: glycosyltransferase family 4 protein [Patescibacteria group bacterium]